jgi:putative restriction endonuclease
MTLSPQKSKLVDQIVASARLCGGTAIVLNREHPVLISFSFGERRLKALFYIWQITHGGGQHRPAHEQRIQITGVPGRFLNVPGATTFIFGWSPTYEVFAAWEYSRHADTDFAHRSSPSMQVPQTALIQAQSSGLAYAQNQYAETVVAIRPDYLSAYLAEWATLHNTPEAGGDAPVVKEIVGQDIEAPIKDIPEGPRKVKLVELQRKVRDARFRTNVIGAYQRRCAISGYDIDMIEAAHIVPVEHKDGTDSLSNGLCLTVIHHVAFDKGLIGVGPTYKVLINQSRLEELKRLSRDVGWDWFKQSLRDDITLPSKREFYPDPEKLRVGLKLRGWTDSQIR